MLYIMLAYLLMFTDLFSAVCLHNAYFLQLTFANAFCFHALSLGYCQIVCLFIMLSCIIYSAFNQLVFLILCSHSAMKGLSALWRNST